MPTPSSVDDGAVKVYLDDESLTTEGETLGAALRAGVARARERGRLVVEINADGASIPEEHLADPPAFEPYAEELRLVSVEPGLLVRSTLLDAAEALEAIRERQRRAGELIQTGETAEAMTELTEVISVWSAVRRALEDGCTLLGLPLSDAIAGADGRRLVDDLTGRLTDIRSALQAEDWSSLSDAVAYDLDEQAQRWTTVLRDFAARLETDRGDDRESAS